jgi:hypothetical protein
MDVGWMMILMKASVVTATMAMMKAGIRYFTCNDGGVGDDADDRAARGNRRRDNKGMSAVQSIRRTSALTAGMLSTIESTTESSKIIGHSQFSSPGLSGQSTR